MKYDDLVPYKLWCQCCLLVRAKPTPLSLPLHSVCWDKLTQAGLAQLLPQEILQCHRQVLHHPLPHSQHLYVPLNVTSAPSRFAVYAQRSIKNASWSRYRSSGKVEVSRAQWWWKTRKTSSAFITGFSFVLMSSLHRSVNSPLMYYTASAPLSPLLYKRFIHNYIIDFLPPCVWPFPSGVLFGKVAANA